jgi:hypothetical protein
MRFLYLLEQAAGGAELGQGSGELVVVFQFLALLRRHVGFQENLARISGLSRSGERREQERKCGKEKQTDFVHSRGQRMIPEQCGVATAGSIIPP